MGRVPLPSRKQLKAQQEHDKVKQLMKKLEKKHLKKDPKNNRA